MGTRPVARGEVGEHVRRRIVELRRERRMTLDDLSRRLMEIGHPLRPNGLSRIETGERRVDVDDLAAISIALDVTPNALLFPGGIAPVDVGGEKAELIRMLSEAMQEIARLRVERQDSRGNQ